MFLLKNGALYFITQQKKSFFSEIFNVVRLMDEKQTKYAPALAPPLPTSQNHHVDPR
jgi:Tfp pilus assembly protein PilZ